MSVESLSATAERTLRLVDILLTHPEGLSPQEMLLHLGGSRSSLFILLRTFKTLGYIEQVEKRGRYRCGPRLLAWRHIPDDYQQNLVNAFYQETARQSWPETLLLVTSANDEALLVLAQAESSQCIRSVYPSGEISSALESARLALKPYPSEEIIHNGFSLIHANHLYELALPICPDGSRPQAALVLSAPSFRWEQKALLEIWLPELRAMAARLSYRLGALVYTPYQSGWRKDLPAATPLNNVEINDFLQGPWTARLACLRPDGKPHVIPVWQEWNGSTFTLIAWEGSQWADYVTQNPEVSLTIDEPWPPLRRVTARGKASPLKLSASELLKLESRLSRRYLGEANHGRAAGPLHGAYRITIEILRGWQGLPGRINDFNSTVGESQS